ncbi:ribonuclease D [Amaricoccus solimangrovi]|uniref:Ribonuclease D n=1 Tax=Amaricoccus solimangrovi TaxID=2589815 RepID=A0A501WZ41_9RHOB|nr:ribonuclease D [Amaricoccus solimangrovi]TPE53575.1 ribonuclease D [Amaricoccus solimangrovi]
MKPITETDDLARFCADCADVPYVTLDTEFLRERTYYAQLCLVQLARPGKGNDTAVLIDALAPGLSLEPLYELFRNPKVVKVFHAARQDLEIFQLSAGVLPKPFFDTQVAAMVCGYGDQVSYETLARQIARASIDKSSRFTDWSRRPLSEAQMAYALADVTHLRRVYEVLSQRLRETGRESWVSEELAVLTDPATYAADPALAWTRLKTRSSQPRFLAALSELARFREETAQGKNVPRSRIMKDDALLEIAANRPKTHEDLAKSRLLLREARRGEIADGILAAIARAEKLPASEIPKPREDPPRKPGSEALADLLRVLLKARADSSGVAQRLIASGADLDALAAEQDDVPALNGWRYEVFGRDASALREGRIALAADGGAVKVVPLD